MDIEALIVFDTPRSSKDAYVFRAFARIEARSKEELNSILLDIQVDYPSAIISEVLSR